jgi:hypothetical protein
VISRREAPNSAYQVPNLISHHGILQLQIRAVFRILLTSVKSRMLLRNWLTFRGDAPIQFGQVVEVYQQPGLEPPEVHGGNQTLSSGQRFGIATMLTQNRQDSIQRIRYQVPERRRLHWDTH